MLQELQRVISTEIPLSQALGVRVESFDGSTLCLHAPLDKNTNHKSTAFGGSLYCVTVLSGWGLIYLVLQQKGLKGHIVIQESFMRYDVPVVSDLRACCQLPSDEELNKFLIQYQRRGKARIALDARIEQDAVPAVSFKGIYVVHT